jgi:hypothetical protein
VLLNVGRRAHVLLNVCRRAHVLLNVCRRAHVLLKLFVLVFSIVVSKACYLVFCSCEPYIAPSIFSSVNLLERETKGYHFAGN